MTLLYGASNVTRDFTRYITDQEKKRVLRLRSEDMKPSRQLIFTKPENKDGQSSMRWLHNTEQENVLGIKSWKTKTYGGTNAKAYFR
jgi:hypothetical protein